MKILGISFLSDASAVLLENGRLVAAISEERLNRVKLWNGIPLASIAEVLRIGKTRLEDIDLIATHGACPAVPDQAAFDQKEKEIKNSRLSEDIKNQQLEHLKSRFDHEATVFAKRTPEYLKQIEALGKPVVKIGHHEAHAASAYYASGWKECFVLTADGWGEDGSSHLYWVDNGKWTRISYTAPINSLGYFYGSITKALGFIPHRHEGKILGLAAHHPHPKSIERIGKMVGFDAESFRFTGRMDEGLYVPRFENPALKEYVSHFSREDVAAAAQQTLESVVTQFVSKLKIPGHSSGKFKIALAGGIFANVKLNQRIAELANVEEIYVCPNMGDGGLSLGAAWRIYHDKTGNFPEVLDSVLLGPEFSDEEIENELKRYNLNYKKFENIHVEIADLLRKGEVVARFWGRMEFGPRALGSRSLMYKASEPEVNVWLNKRLKRSEFMPFAPATLDEDANSCYVGLEKAHQPAQFMTTTLDCTPKMRTEAPAAVHVDGTARPQVITEKKYPDFYKILKEYKKVTGFSTLINTSFNMHEEPIVCNPTSAIKATLDGELPYLAIGNYLVSTGIKK